MTGNLSLFRNDKGGAETRPDYRGMGRCRMADGTEVEMKLAGWIKTDKRGEKFISLKLEPDTRAQQPAPAPRPTPAPAPTATRGSALSPDAGPDADADAADIADDIPF